MKESTCHHHSSNENPMLPDYTRRSYNLPPLTKTNSTPSPTLIQDCPSSCSSSVNNYPFHAKVILVITTITCPIIVTLLLYYSLNGKISILQPAKPWSPQSFGSKLELTARYWTLPIFWLTFNVLTVISRRMIHPTALNPLGLGEKFTQREKNILINSIEQVVISIIAQISMLTYLEGEQVTRVIPMVNSLFLIGRITFWLGYPFYRTFGFIFTFFPSLLMVFFSLYRFLYSHLDVI